MKASDLRYTIEPQFVPVGGRWLVTCGQLQSASERFCSVCASAQPHQALVLFKMLSTQLCSSTLSHKSSIVWPFSEEHIMCGGTTRPSCVCSACKGALGCSWCHPPLGGLDCLGWGCFKLVLLGLNLSMKA